MPARRRRRGARQRRAQGTIVPRGPDRWFTGMRPGEAFGLKWADLEGRRLRVMRAVAEAAPGRYEVKEPKTRHGIRSIVLTQEHRRLLEERRGAPEGFVFPACSTSSRPKAAQGHANITVTLQAYGHVLPQCRRTL